MVSVPHAPVAELAGKVGELKSLLAEEEATVQHLRGLLAEEEAKVERVRRMLEGEEVRLHASRAAEADWRGDSEEGSERSRSVEFVFPEVPQDALCPITKMTMEDPVTTCADGHSYERKAIEAWFSSGQVTSPVTNCRLPFRTTVPNHALRNLIQALSVHMPQGRQEEADERGVHLDLGAIVSALAADQEHALAKAAGTPTASSSSSVVCEEDPEVLLQRRRREELEFYGERGRRTSAVQFVVDRAWWTRWYAFLYRDELPPGPIHNAGLVDSTGLPRPDLRRGDHWHVVNEAVWHFLQARYGGGPALPRGPPYDLYGQ